MPHPHPPKTSQQIAARHEAIFGKPLRVRPVIELTEELRELFKLPPGFEKYIGRTPPKFSDSKPADVVRVMAHNPGLLRKFQMMMPFFMLEGTLEPRDRELAIMRTAWIRQIPFVWGEHVDAAKRVGLTSGDLDRIAEGSTAAGWNDHDRAVLRAVDELIDDAMITEGTWSVLAKLMNEGQLVEFPVLVGQYLLMGFYQNSLCLPLWEGSEGLFAR